MDTNWCACNPSTRARCGVGGSVSPRAQVPWIGRKAAKTLTPTLIIEQDGDTIKETSKGFKTMVVVLTAGGPPFEHKDPGVRCFGQTHGTMSSWFTVHHPTLFPGQQALISSRMGGQCVHRDDHTCHAWQAPYQAGSHDGRRGTGACAAAPCLPAW